MAKKMQKGKKRKKQNNILFIIFFVGTLIFVAAYGMLFSDIAEKNAAKEIELHELEETKKTKQKELNKKTMEVNYYQSDENIEKLAREELGLVKPQEVVFITSAGSSLN